MAIKTYEFDYNFGDAFATFEVDSEIFTDELARNTLTFFVWDYNKKNDPVDEVMKKYALQAITFATEKGLNELGVISEFENYEGFYPVDGQYGIKLMAVSEYEFSDTLLIMEVKSK